MKQWAEWLCDHRVVVGIAILLVTAFFAWEIRHVDLATDFRDLYPKGHPHTDLFRKYPAFGSPLTVSLVVQVKKGSIYNPETLKKIQEATRLANLIPGVDHHQVVSIASRKVKHLQATVGAIESTSALLASVPQTLEEIQRLRDKVRWTEGAMGSLVSRREDAALVQATFVERLTDYDVIFSSVNSIIAKLQDADHEIYAAGQPLLTGWVYFYGGQMFLIFAVTILGMILLLAFHMRNLAGVVTPVLVSATTSVWGLGFAGLFKIGVDPLIMVLPMLLVARSLSHAVQACERYFEIYADTQNKREACVGSLASIFPPGTLGVITDAAGLFLIGVAPIPLMHKVALVCGFWALSLIPANVLLTPLVLSFLPAPRNAAQLVGRVQANGTETGAGPGDFDRYVTADFSAANITVWYKDHRAETIKRALRRVETFLSNEGAHHGDGLKVRLASGTMGLLGAINDAVARSGLQMLVLVVAAVFVTCGIAYKSFVAALLLLVPVNVSNLIGNAVMVMMGIGLDVNTSPVAAVGIGVGIDYGIYLLSRACEEATLQGSVEKAVSTAITTTGRAIFFTGTTLLIGLAPWYFLSDLRFQADMGLLIAFLMLINMVVSLVLLPLLLVIVQPKFVARRKRDGWK